MPKNTLSLIVIIFFLLGCEKVEHVYHQAFRAIDHAIGSGGDNSIAPVVVETKKATIEVLTLRTNFYLPWAVTVLPDNTLLITEKSGHLYQYDPSTKTDKRILGLPKTKKWGQGGLMDVVAHPDFINNRWIYFSYAGLMDGNLAATRVARGQLIEDELSGVEILFTASPSVKSGSHFGSALTFDDKGFLYITSGERGQRSDVQRLDTHLGKVIRLHDDGRVPKDNPFVGVVDALPEIYSYGHRNPQGIAIEPTRREIWSVEHGPKGGDEVNVLRPGLNYGWPVISLGKEYDTGLQIGEGVAKPGMEQPLYFYIPSIATSSMHFYKGNAFPEWKGSLLIGALSQTHINRLEVVGGKVVYEERMLEGLKKRIRDIAESVDGFLYVLTDDGHLLLLKPVAKS